MYQLGTGKISLVLSIPQQMFQLAVAWEISLDNRICAAKASTHRKTSEWSMCALPQAGRGLVCSWPWSSLGLQAWHGLVLPFVVWEVCMCVRKVGAVLFVYFLLTGHLVQPTDPVFNILWIAQSFKFSQEPETVWER